MNLCGRNLCDNFTYAQLCFICIHLCFLIIHLCVSSIDSLYTDLGTSYGEPQDKFADVPSVLTTDYAAFEPLVLGVSGDQTQACCGGS